MIIGCLWEVTWDSWWIIQGLWPGEGRWTHQAVVRALLGAEAATGPQLASREGQQVKGANKGQWAQSLGKLGKLGKLGTEPDLGQWHRRGIMRPNSMMSRQWQKIWYVLVQRNNYLILFSSEFLYDCMCVCKPFWVLLLIPLSQIEEKWREMRDWSLRYRVKTTFCP